MLSGLAFFRSVPQFFYELFLSPQRSAEVSLPLIEELLADYACAHFRVLQEAIRVVMELASITDVAHRRHVWFPAIGMEAVFKR